MTALPRVHSPYHRGRRCTGTARRCARRRWTDCCRLFSRLESAVRCRRSNLERKQHRRKQSKHKSVRIQSNQVFSLESDHASTICCVHSTQNRLCAAEKRSTRGTDRSGTCAGAVCGPSPRGLRRSPRRLRARGSSRAASGVHYAEAAPGSLLGGQEAAAFSFLVLFLPSSRLEKLEIL
jgi:hypothetical protein